MLKFCERIKETGIETWSVDHRVNLVDRHLLVAMKNAGCEEIYFGVESGSQKMLKVLNKAGVSIENIIKAFDLCYEIGIRTYAGFMVGLPGETIENLNETFNLARRIPATQYRAVNYVPYSGTELCELAKGYGFSEPNKMIDWEIIGDYERSNSNFSLVSIDELTSIKNKIERLTYIKSLKYGLKHRDFTGVMPILASKVNSLLERHGGKRYLRTSFRVFAEIWRFVHIANRQRDSYEHNVDM